MKWLNDRYCFGLRNARMTLHAQKPIVKWRNVQIPQMFWWMMMIIRAGLILRDGVEAWIREGG